MEYINVVKLLLVSFIALLFILAYLREYSQYSRIGGLLLLLSIAIQFPRAIAEVTRTGDIGYYALIAVSVVLALLIGKEASELT